MARKITPLEFVIKANAKHGGLYSYDESEYKGNEIPVKIICGVHGPFMQTPHEHLAGCGCRKCGQLKTATKRMLGKELFVQRSISVHGSIYDYSDVVYRNANTKVKIGCKKHGIFTIVPSSHLKGLGCKWCAKEERKAISSKKHQQLFLEKAKAAHGGKFDYSLVDYIDSFTKVKITCNIHKITFEQIPSTHLIGNGGCPSCKGEGTSKRFRSDLASFIVKAKGVHGDKYIYDSVVYTGSKNKVTIICKEHGEFYQKPNDHLDGHGCSRCNWSDGGYNQSFFEAHSNRRQDNSELYILSFKDEKEEFIKVGITINTAKERFANKYGYTITKILGVSRDLYDSYILEQEILSKFKHLSYYPKKEFGGRTECFLPSAEEPIVNYVLSKYDGVALDWLKAKLTFKGPLASSLF